MIDAYARDGKMTSRVLAVKGKDMSSIGVLGIEVKEIVNGGEAPKEPLVCRKGSVSKFCQLE